MRDTSALKVPGNTGDESLSGWALRRLFRASATLLLAAGLATTAGAATQTFVSDTTWSVRDASAVLVGTAQLVCPSSSQPACPPGATIFGLPGAIWSANLSTIPGANWVWAPGITGATPNASLAKYSFTKTFTLAGSPVSGTVSVAADDFAEVFVNGTSAGSVGSISNQSAAGAAQTALTVFNIAPLLVSGSNTITIVGQNGPDSFAGVTNANYSQNVAGVVFGGTLVDAVTPATTTTGLVSSANPSLVGQLVTFAATVSGSNPTGTVQFKDGASNLGAPVALSGASASFSTAALALGPHSIVASYSGDPNNLASTSPVVTQIVNAVPTPPQPSQIPTLSETAVLLLSGLLSALALLRLRARLDKTG